MDENHGIGARRQAVILSQEPLDEKAFCAVIDAPVMPRGYPKEDMRKEGAVPVLEVIFGEPLSGGFSRTIWLEHANQ